MCELGVSILVHQDFSRIYGALESLLAYTKTPACITVVINVGNASDIDALRSAYPTLNYIINPHPQGFAQNHNMVMQQTSTPYIALLNDDIRLKNDALDQAITYLAQHPDVGMVAPQLEYEDGALQVTTYSAPTLSRMIYKISGLGRFTHQKSSFRQWLIRLGIGKVLNIQSLHFEDKIREAEVLKAAAIIVRKTAVQDVGGMDETTKSFGEEIDWNWRMRQNNWKLVLLPHARIVHYGVGQAMMQLQGWQILEDRKGILNYYLKHRPRHEQWLIRGAIVVLHTLQAIFSLIFDPKAVKTHWQTALMGATWQRS